MSHAIPPPPDPELADRDREIFRIVAVEGRSTSDVARDFSLSQRHVQRIVRRTQRQLVLRQLMRAPDPRWLSEMHLRRLEHQWQEAMVAWYRSHLPSETIKYSTERGSDKAKIERTRREQQGDVRYLENARRILADIRALIAGGALGDAGEGFADVSTLTVDQRRTELALLADALRDRWREEEDWGTDPGPDEANASRDSEA